MKRTIDTEALYAAVEAVRRERGVSMRQLAKDIGVSPSLLSRLANGLKPDVDGLMTLTTFLGTPAEDFLVGEDSSDEPELLAQLAPLLRARSDLDSDDVRHLEAVIDSAVRFMRAAKSKS